MDTKDQRQAALISHELKKTSDKAYWLGVALGFLIGLVLGVAIGYDLGSDTVLVVPLGRGIET